VATSFTYKAIDKAGAKVSGNLTAADRRTAFDLLSSRGLAPFELNEKAAAGRSLIRRRSINRKDLLRYTRQLATLLTANLGILETLATLSQSDAHSLLSERTKRLKQDLRAGQRFSEALKTHLPELPGYVARLAELGEATGALAKALSDAADRMEYEETMRAEIRSALTYPTFLATVGGLIVLLLFYFVVPRFATLLGDNISSAPAISQAVINSGVWLKDNIVLTLLGFGAVFGLTTLALRSTAARAAFRDQMERLPVVGPFLRQAEVGAWTRTVGVALANKAQLVDALRLGEAGANSPGFRRSLETVRRDVRAGRPLEEALADACETIDPVVIDLIRTGRSAGVLSDMLLFAADMFEKEAKDRGKRMTALTEPMAILLISLIVGTIILSIVMAMTSLYQFDI